MYAAQTVPFPNPTVHHHQIKLHQKVAFLPNPQLGFFNSAKRVSESKPRSRKSGRLSVIMCEALHKKQEDKFDDGYYMRRCVELAKKAIGCTNPNPMVGCVIVKDGKIVGEGFHPKAGQPHAEVFALRDAGDQAENGTAYVSLEPCNHYGRTPPCTEALIKAKVRKVVVGMVDPNPIVASRGVKKLQEAGIKVTVGVEEQMCKRLNEVFIHHILTGRPFVTLRYSMSLDGQILNHLGEDAIECGGYYSKLMQEYDAIILSSTALAEKSSFPISKEAGANQPVKIVLSKSPNSKVKIPTLDNDATCKFQMLSFDKVSLLEILENCKRQGLCSVLLDLRGNNDDFEDLVKEGFELNLFQKVVVEVLPFLGGGGEKVSRQLHLKVKAEKLTSCVDGKSVLLEGYF
ncbi:hypothetical protein CASFOL_037456 [Castilleja foliolosa]|uniref:Riboflavin biosynthesis protein PYRD, chloroplastic n=1 Tax=Castilleja foliolosa TaxID=1961234 RepID=A0ABD3BMY9_9LAMI